jgi:hypothetical protein
MRYTIQDYSNFSFENEKYKLTDDVINKIQKLIKELKINTNNQGHEDNDKYVKGRFIPKQSRYVESLEGKNNKTDESWKTNILFKATKIEKKEGVEKTINDIRISLNKISIKNYEQQRETIFQLIKELIKNDLIENEMKKNIEKNKNEKIENKIVTNSFEFLLEEENDDENNGHDNNLNDTIKIKQIAQCIFDIASSNKFYSELYAKLYRELIEEYKIFVSFTINLIEQYKKDLNNIKLVDSNKDYEEYCENNKSNDKRKALTTFIANLMKENILSKKDVFQLIVDLQKIVMLQIDIDDTTYQVDEITENIFILITLVANEFKILSNIEETEEIKILKNIKENIILSSKYKTKEHKSISSRAIFKYMDMKELILKNEK